MTTIWNRLRTALARLRQDLDARHGDRRAFLLPLLSVNQGIATGVLAVSAKGKVLGGVVLAAVALSTLWISDLLPIAPPPAPALPVPVAPMTADLAPDHGAPSPAPQRTEVAPSAPVTLPTTGTLIVSATYQPDGDPVADLIVSVRPAASESRFDWRLARTDDQGIARVAGLPPGEHQVLTPRNWRAGARATVVAGAEQRVSLTLGQGIHLTGIVVDIHDVAVAGAEVHVAPGAAQRFDLRPLAITGAEGRFDLRFCSERCLVGARAAGHAPSWMRYVNLQEGGSIDLRLGLPGPGGVVEGTVFGSVGTFALGPLVPGRWRVCVQVPGSELVAGSSNEGRLPGTIRMTEARSLAPGDYVVNARGDGRSVEARFTVREGGDEVVRIDMR